ncbi:NAD-dependent histone deacetylase sir2 [Coemansia spiralis]|uniref:NAD-dependent histone deacetylase sir2 n=2 Tax=Coemansia TaxID=4863 RepID=A0A9W8G0R6_9FUNG|nr:NAD-dependent histone deacetylase sir2 [Coemansia umbellata]KAJ2624418.1 NAD-dependent histone deacetylase sir2 [Coemansia sp. RSA 1358]KAJ2674784.1 NAD-dependent histone deacetylase sir2 [Coemansia spiralis]
MTEEEFIKQSENGILLASFKTEDGPVDAELDGAFATSTCGFAANNENSSSAVSISKRRKESLVEYEQLSVSVDENKSSSKRHRIEATSIEVAQAVTRGTQSQISSTIATRDSEDVDLSSDSFDKGSGASNDEDADDEDLNIDGSYAPSPLNAIDMDTQVPEYTRFTPEEMEIIRSEAHALGLGAFLQQYIAERQVPVRALLEVFMEPSLLRLPLPEFQLLPLLRNQLIRFFRNRPKLQHINTVDDVVALLKNSKRIMVLTGAGVSVSCGIPDFRSPTGIYTRLNEEFGLDDPQQMFDIEYFREMPELFYSFAKDLYPGNFQPAPSHAFVKLLEEHGKLLRNYTQNIDTLEHVQGIKNVLNCHGSFATATCIKCGYKCSGKELEEDIMAKRIAYCPKCNDHPHKKQGSADGASDSLITGVTVSFGQPVKQNSENYVYNENDNDEDEDDDGDYGAIRGIMKPDITFFGEKLPDQFDEALTIDREQVDLLLVMGSSLKVAPVSDIMGNLPHTVPQIVINKTPILHFNFDVQLLGNADDIVAYLAERCGWDLCHPRIPGESTISEDFAYAGIAPIDSPPSITFPIRIPNEKEEDKEKEDRTSADASVPSFVVIEKTYSLPSHWHPFPSAVITGKDLFVANGDAKVRLAVSSSDEENDGSDADDSISSNDSGDEANDSSDGSSNSGDDKINTPKNEGHVHSSDDSNNTPESSDSGEELARDISKASV